MVQRVIRAKHRGLLTSLSANQRRGYLRVCNIKGGAKGNSCKASWPVDIIVSQSEKGYLRVCNIKGGAKGNSCKASWPVDIIVSQSENDSPPLSPLFEIFCSFLFTYVALE